ncbi:ribosomal protein S18-alanine N-acetyltransferase [Globicatella sulfidifaciens]
MIHWLIQQLTKFKTRLSGKHLVTPTMPKIMEQLDWQAKTHPEGFVLRLCHQSDLEFFEQIEKQTYDGYLAWHKADFLNDWRKNPYALYLVIELQGKLVGVITGRVLYRNSHISQLMVLPRYQSKGLGQWLVSEWLFIAEQFKTKQITLEVRESNQRAQKLYQKMGFQVIDQRENYYYNNHETALIMCRREKE